MKMKTMCSAVLMIGGIALFGTINSTCAEATTHPDSSSGQESYGKAQRFEVEPFIGRHFFENKQNLQDSTTYGVRLDYNFTKHFGVEGYVGVVNSHVDDATRKGAFMGQYRFPTSGVDVNQYGLNAIYQFTPDRRFSPFAVLGFSKFRYSPQVLGNNTNTLDYGVGAKYWMARDVALRVDLKDQTDRTYHNYSATLGVVYAFGGNKRAPAPVATPEPIPETIPEPIPVTEEPPMDEPVTRPAPEEKTITLVFEDVHFNFDKSTLTDEAKRILDRNIQILREHPDTRVRIAGCTSLSGSEEYNQRLSERRAESVKRYLVTLGGISSSRLTTIGYGEKHLAEYEANPRKLYSDAAMANMRVLFETIVR